MSQRHKNELHFVRLERNRDDKIFQACDDLIEATTGKRVPAVLSVYMFPVEIFDKANAALLAAKANQAGARDMTESMVERVARAIYEMVDEPMGEPPWGDFRAGIVPRSDAARVVIADAMREPTEAMVDSFPAVMPGTNIQDFTRIWHAAIDAALNEGVDPAYTSVDPSNEE